jgi:DNA-binding winged helix-turn-helix (wHTH) protein
LQAAFDEFVLDSASRQLLRAGAPVHLSPKAFELLTTLVETRPRALAKAEIHERLWPATFVSEANLASLVAEIRSALGDDARRPRYVRTVQRYGYAFCAPAAAGASGGTAMGLSFRILHDRRELALGPGEHILGRTRHAAVFIDSKTVSRAHARITVYADRAVLEDLDSKNGTSLRGQRVTAPVALSDGDDIAVGSIHMTFRVLRGGSSTESARSSQK